MSLDERRHLARVLAELDPDPNGGGPNGGGPNGGGGPASADPGTLANPYLANPYLANPYLTDAKLRRQRRLALPSPPPAVWSWRAGSWSSRPRYRAISTPATGVPSG